MKCNGFESTRLKPQLTGVRPVAARLLLLFVTLTACTPTSQHYEIHSGELSCDEANRFVYDAVVGLGRVITGFKLAKPGTPGYVRVKQGETAAEPSATVKVSCDSAGAHIVTDEGGLTGDKRLSRGIYLSVTGRARLSVNQHQNATQEISEGVDRSRALDPTPAAAAETVAAPPSPPARRRVEAKQAVGVVLKLEPIYGFATVLDFEADLSEAGVLPVKVSVINGTARIYEFDPADITLRRSGSRQRAKPLTPDQVVSKLEQTLAHLRAAADGGGDPSPVAASDLGDVGAASRLVKELHLKATRLTPHKQHSGFLYYDVAEYDRARLTLIDVATGETEGFLVDF